MTRTRQTTTVIQIRLKQNSQTTAGSHMAVLDWQTTVCSHMVETRLTKHYNWFTYDWNKTNEQQLIHIRLKQDWESTVGSHLVEMRLANYSWFTPCWNETYKLQLVHTKLKWDLQSTAGSHLVEMRLTIYSWFTQSWNETYKLQLVHTKLKQNLQNTIESHMTETRLTKLVYLHMIRRRLTIYSLFTHDWNRSAKL